MRTQDLLQAIQSQPQPETQTRHGYALLRVSTDQQDEQAQRRDIEQACQRHHLVVTRWHAEREKANERRPEFEKFLKDAVADPECSFVIARDSSRVARSAARIAEIEELLCKGGVRLLCDCRHVDFANEISVGGVWLSGVLRLQSEAYSAQCRDWTMKSMAYLCRQRDPQTGWCYKLGGRTLFGYRAQTVSTGQRDRRGNAVTRKVWMLDEHNAPLVRAIWLDWYCGEHLGHDMIARRLSNLGITARNGQALSSSTVLGWRNPTNLLMYLGYYVWNKNAVHRLGAIVPMQSKPTHEWEIVPDAHAAIFTPEEVTRIEDETARRNQRRANGISPRSERCRVYALTGGLAKCLACGANIVGHRYSHNCSGYYVCGSHKYRGGHGCAPWWSVRCDHLDRDILRTAVQTYPTTPAKVERWAARINKLLRDNLGGAGEAKERIEQELAEAERQITNLVEAIKQGSAMSELLQGESEKLMTRKRELEAQYRGLADLQPPVVTSDVVREYFRGLEGASCTENQAERRAWLRTICERVEFDPHAEQVEVAFTFDAILTHTMVPPRGVEPRLPS